MYSINLTIHNKDFLIYEVLERIKKYTVGNYEMVVVLDGCTDKSENIVCKWFESNAFIEHKILKADNIFETKSNNIAAKNSTGDYIIIVQDDMLINEMEWNKRIAHPFNLFDDIFAVTARYAHNWVINPNSEHIKMEQNLNTCYSDILIHTDHAHRGNIDRDTFAIRNSVNRGPLVVKHDVFNSLNYFDEIYAPLDMDDHDLCMRAKLKYGLLCGCYWIDYISDDDWGGTRLNGSPRDWVLEANHKNQKIYYNRYKDYINNATIINRKCTQ